MGDAEMKAVVVGRFGAQAAEAHRAVEQRGKDGKIVLAIREEDPSASAGVRA